VTTPPAWTSTTARAVWLARWLAVWTAVAVVFGVQSALFLSAGGEVVPWTAVAAWAASEWYTWALLSPLVVVATRRFPLERGAWRTSIPVHLALSVVFGLLQAALQAWMKHAGLGGDLRPRPFGVIFIALLTAKAQINPLTYWIIAAVTTALDLRRRARARELAASELRALLAQTQLQVLRTQLNPHFLFNALNTVSELIETEPRTAIRMVARLGDFLRLTLKGSTAETVTLGSELALVDGYLDVERARFEARLHVRVDVAPEILSVEVPPLILQPLVENAVRHGVSRLAGPGHVALVGRRVDGELHVEVLDDGPGWAPPEPGAEGLGLANTQARLRHVYGGRASLDVEPRQGGGTCVRLRLPWPGGSRAAQGGAVQGGAA
jgi:two-component system, LytTR family, sensor kinase